MANFRLLEEAKLQEPKETDTPFRMLQDEKTPEGKFRILGTPSTPTSPEAKPEKPKQYSKLQIAKYNFDMANLQNQRSRIGYALRNGSITEDEAIKGLKDIDSEIANKYNKDLENPKGFLNQMTGATASLVPYMFESQIEGMKMGGITGLGTGAMAALITGGPEPTDIITAPSAASMGYLAGHAWGVMRKSDELEGGSIYLDLVKSGVEPNLASTVSSLAGMSIGLVENAQLNLLTKPFMKLFAKGGTKAVLNNKIVGPAIKKFATSMLKMWGAETGEEEIQWTIEHFGKVLAHAIDAKNKKIDYRGPDATDYWKGFAETLETSAKGFPAIVAGPAAISAKVDISSRTQLKKTINKISKEKSAEFSDEAVPENKIILTEEQIAKIEGAEKGEKDVKKSRFYKAMKPKGTAGLEILGKGTYVSPTKEGASFWGYDVKEVEADIKNPLIIQPDESIVDKGWDEKTPIEEWAQKQGYDSIIRKSVKEGHDHIVIFDKEKVSLESDEAVPENKIILTEEQIAKIEGKEKPEPVEKTKPDEEEKITRKQEVEETIAGTEAELDEIRRVKESFLGRIRRHKGDYLAEEFEGLPRQFVSTKETAISPDEALEEARREGFNFNDFEEMKNYFKEIAQRERDLKQDLKGFREELRHEIKKEKRAAQRQAIRDKFKARFQQYNDVKASIVEYAKNYLTLHDRGKLLSTVKNAKTINDLRKAEAMIDRLQEQTDRRILKESIKKELKESRARKQGGKPIGRFTPDIQVILDFARGATRMTKVQAQEKINGNLKQYQDKIPPPEIALENKILSMMAGAEEMTTDELAKTLSLIRKLKQTGKTIKEFKDIARKVKAKQDIEKVIDVITGGKGITWTKTAAIKEYQYSKIRGRIAQFGKSQVGWQDLMDILSYNVKDKPGESFLNDFADVFNVTVEESRGNRVAFEQIREFGKKAYGFKKDKHFANKLMKDLQDNFIYKGKNSLGQDIVIEMNRQQVRKRWMELQDPSLVEVFMHEKGMAYTEDIVRALDNFLTKEDRVFALEQLKFYREYYNKVNEVYRDIYGVDLPFNEFYSPIAREGAELTGLEGITTLMQEVEQRSSVTTGSLKSRIKNYHRIAEQSDVTVLQKHIVEMEHFIAWANKVRELKTVFGNTNVKKAIIAYYGKGMLSKVDSFIEDFTRNGISRAKRVEGLDRFRANFVRSVLSVKPSIGAKQLTSYLAYMEAMPVKDFVIGQMDFWLRNPIRKSKILLGGEYLRTRGQNITRDIQVAMQTDEYKNFRNAPNFWNSLMLNVQLGDKGAILIGGWSLYKYELKRNNGDHQAAMRIFEKFTDRTQQSGSIEQLSSVQRGGSWAKLFTMFKSAPAQYFRKELGAVKNILLGKGSKTQALKTIAIYHIVLPCLFQFVANGFRWDEEDMERAALLGPLNGIPLMGDALDGVIRVALGQRTYDLANPVSGVAKDAFRAVDAIHDMVSEEGINNEDMSRAIKGILAVAGALRGAPLESGYSMAEGAFKIGVGQFKDGMLQSTGWSEWTIAQSKKKEKKKWRMLIGY